MLKRFIGLPMVATLALGMGAMFASPSSAATALQTCTTVKGSATFTPGLGSTPQDQTVKAHGTETGCTPSAKTGGSGVLAATIKLKAADCSTLIAGGQTLHGTGATTWKNGKVSHYALTFKTGTGNQITVATITGKVSSGLFSGHAITGKIKFTVVGSPDCNTTPVTKVTFKNTTPFVIH
jgi:hypothetical protein